MAKTITPITRNPIFYDEQEYDFETDMVAEYIEGDLNQTIVLYQVDRERTNMDSTYKQTNVIRYKTPIELPCIYEIADSEIKSYDKVSSNAVYSITGGLTFTIMTKTIEKYSCEINRGDYVGVLIDNSKMIYFVVFDDGKVNYTNKNYIGAYKPSFRIIKASPVTEEEFKAI